MTCRYCHKDVVPDGMNGKAVARGWCSLTCMHMWESERDYHIDKEAAKE